MPGISGPTGLKNIAHSMTFNDNGQLVVWQRLADTADPFASATSTAYIVIQVPAAGTGSLALLGMGVIARRRRR